MDSAHLIASTSHTAVGADLALPFTLVRIVFHSSFLVASLGLFLSDLPPRF